MFLTYFGDRRKEHAKSWVVAMGLRGISEAIEKWYEARDPSRRDRGEPAFVMRYTTPGSGDPDDAQRLIGYVALEDRTAVPPEGIPVQEGGAWDYCRGVDQNAIRFLLRGGHTPVHVRIDQPTELCGHPGKKFHTKWIGTDTCRDAYK